MSLLKAFLRREKKKKVTQTSASPKLPRLCPHHWKATQPQNDAGVMTSDRHRSLRQPRVEWGAIRHAGPGSTAFQRGARRRPEGDCGSLGSHSSRRAGRGWARPCSAAASPSGSPLARCRRDSPAELCVFPGGRGGRSGAGPALPANRRSGLSASPAGRGAQPGPRPPPRQRAGNNSHGTRDRHSHG